MTRPAIGAALLVAAAAIVVVAKFSGGAPTPPAVAGNGARIERWLFGDPQLMGNHLATLAAWMRSDTVDPALGSVPYTALLSDPGLEADRERSIAALGIP